MRYRVSIPLESSVAWDDPERWLTLADCETPEAAAAVVAALIRSPSARTQSLRVEATQIKES